MVSKENPGQAGQRKAYNLAKLLYTILELVGDEKVSAFAGGIIGAIAGGVCGLLHGFLGEDSILDEEEDGVKEPEAASPQR